MGGAALLAKDGAEPVDRHRLLERDRRRVHLEVGADLRVDLRLHGGELLGSERLGVRKVEAELLGVAEGAALVAVLRRGQAHFSTHTRVWGKGQVQPFRLHV